MKEIMTKRVDAYKKDEDSENQLNMINNMIQPIELEINENYSSPVHPVLFVVGAPRSATTLTYQLIADTKLFSYISNFTARFWKAPTLGMILEKSLNLGSNEIGHESNYGRTKGLHEPHQFNYYWKELYQYDENHQMDDMVISQINKNKFVSQLAAMEAVNAQPLAFKSLYCGLQIPFLKGSIPDSKYVVTLRDPIYQVQSNLLGRKAFFGNYDGWFSLKPKEYSNLIKEDPYHQVAGQIYYILKSIEEGLENMPSSDYIVQNHDFLMNSPSKAIEQIIELVYSSEYGSQFSKQIPDSFTNKNVKRLSDNEWNKMTKAVRHYFGEERDYVPFEEFMRI